MAYQVSWMRFERTNGRVYSFPRPHLRWLTLVDSHTLQVGFSSKLVTLSGDYMERLFEALVKLPNQVIYEEPDQQVDDGYWVKKITVAGHKKKPKPQ